MELLFVGRDKYEKMKKNYQVAMESASVLREQYIKVQEKLKQKETIEQDQIAKISFLEEEVAKLKKKNKSLSAKTAPKKKKEGKDK